MALIFNTEDIEEQLKSMNDDYTNRNKYRSAYMATDLAYQQQQENLQRSYEEQRLQDYYNAYAQKSAIASSNLGQGYKSLYSENIDTALQQAYDTYRQNYLSGMQTLSQQEQEAKGQITSALQTEAQNIASFAEKPYEYLSDLYTQYLAGENTLFDDKNWSKYITTLNDEQRLKTWDELVSEGFFDDTGTITRRGEDFYSQMLNQIATDTSLQKTGAKSFDTWFSEKAEKDKTYKELYDWAMADSKSGYINFKKLAGLGENEDFYNFAQRAAGMNKDELKNYIGNLVTSTETFADTITKGTKNNARVTQKTEEFVKSTIDNLKQVATDLGIYDALENEVSGWSNLEKSLNNYLRSTATGKERWNRYQNVIKGSFTTSVGQIMNEALQTSQLYRSDKEANEAKDKLIDAYEQMIALLINYKQENE